MIQLAATLKGAIGGWVPVFAIIVLPDLVTALPEIGVLKPLRCRASGRAEYEPTGIVGHA